MIKLLPVILISLTLFAENKSNNFFKNSQEGWFSYEIQEVKDENITKQKEKQQLHIPTDLSKLTATELEKLIDNSKDRAVVNPTKENVKNYIMLQNYMHSQADKFSDTWKVLIIENPELDLSTNASKGKFIRKAKYKQKKRDRQEFWQDNINKIRIVFFYNPIDKEITLAQDKVMTMLNYDLPKLEILKINVLEEKELVKEFKINITPDIWIIYEKDGESIWHRLNAGMASKNKILQRVDYIYGKIKDVK